MTRTAAINAEFSNFSCSVDTFGKDSNRMASVRHIRSGELGLRVRKCHEQTKGHHHPWKFSDQLAIGCAERKGRKLSKACDRLCSDVFMFHEAKLVSKIKSHFCYPKLPCTFECHLH